MHEVFLEQLYEEAKTQPRQAVSLLWRYVSDLLDDHNLKAIDAFMEKHGCVPVFGHDCEHPRFEVVDKLLQEVDLNRATTTMLIGFLTTTFSARHRLTAYQPFLKRVYAKLSKTESPERVHRLLAGFER